MRITSLVLTIIFLAIQLGWSNAHGQMLGPNFNSAIQLVVLKNGEIFRGRVSRKSDQVIVETIQGSRIVLSSEQADFVCNSMDEAYWGKSARTRASDSAGQKALFHWCLKNQLLEQAQNQLDILVESDMKAADLEFLDRQLNVAIIQGQNKQQRLAKQATQGRSGENPIEPLAKNPVEPPAKNLVGHQVERQVNPKLGIPPVAAQFALTPIKVNRSIGVAKFDIGEFDTSAFRPLPSISGDSSKPLATIAQSSKPVSVNLESNIQPTIQQVGFNQPIESVASPPDKLQAANFDSVGANQPDERDDRIMTPIHELEREIGALPGGSVGAYRQRVERALTVGCSAAKCHDSNSKVMPLLHRGLSQTIPLRQSQRNLHNVLKYLDRQDPAASPLLIAASTAHAGNEKPIIAPGTANYEHLTKWMISISDAPNTFVSLEPQIDSEAAAPSDPLSQVRPVKPAPATLQPLGDLPLMIPSTIGEIPEFNSRGNGFTPVDPFDPEIFNRKYGGK